MNMPQGFLVGVVLVLGISVAALATWVACRWWYGMKLRAAAQRLKKSDQNRVHLQQQAMAARQQVEALKKELAAQRELVEETQASRQRTRELEQALLAAERAAAASALSDSGFVPLAPSPHHGFADTQIM